jgi:hypothetical protein
MHPHFSPRPLGGRGAGGEGVRIRNRAYEMMAIACAAPLRKCDYQFARELSRTASGRVQVRESRLRSAVTEA